MLTFDEASHTYRFEGRLVPGVTSVLEQLQYLDGVPWAILDAAREFGTHVHLACHLWNVNKLDVEALDPQLRPYLDGWIAFLNQTGFKVRASEQRVYHPQLGYAGTADAFGEMRGTTWVIDIKSGVVPDTVGAQLAAYQNAYSLQPRKRLCVQLTGNGNYKLHPQTDLSDFALFTSALNIYRHKIKRKPVNVSEHA